MYFPGSLLYLIVSECLTTQRWVFPRPLRDKTDRPPSAFPTSAPATKTPFRTHLESHRFSTHPVPYRYPGDEKAEKGKLIVNIHIFLYYISLPEGLKHRKLPMILIPLSSFLSPQSPPNLRRSSFLFPLSTQVRSHLTIVEAFCPGASDAPPRNPSNTRINLFP